MPPDTLSTEKSESSSSLQLLNRSLHNSLSKHIKRFKKTIKEKDEISQWLNKQETNEHDARNHEGERQRCVDDRGRIRDLGGGGGVVAATTTSSFTFQYRPVIVVLRSSHFFFLFALSTVRFFFQISICVILFSLNFFILGVLFYFLNKLIKVAPFSHAVQVQKQNLFFSFLMSCESLSPLGTFCKIFFKNQQTCFMVFGRFRLLARDHY